MNIVFALIALFSFSINSIIFRFLAKDEKESGTLGMLFTAIAGVLALPLVIIEGNANIENTPAAYLIIISLIGWAAFSFAQGWMHHHFKASMNSILGQFTTIASVILGIVFLGERPDLLSLLGIVLIVSGNILLFAKDLERPAFNKLIIRLLISTLLAVVFLTDSISNVHFPTGLFIFLAYFIPGILLIIFVPSITIQKSIALLKKYHYKLLFLSGTSLVGYYFLIQAYNSSDLALVVPITNSTTIATVILSSIFLKEDKSKFLIFIAGLITTTGVILVSI